MLHRHRLGFYGRYFATCSLCRALEICFVGQGFQVYFDDKRVMNFTKGLNLMEFDEGPIAIKYVAYRYSFFVL
jgi:hypothetical protein